MTIADIKRSLLEDIEALRKQLIEARETAPEEKAKALLVLANTVQVIANIDAL